MKKWLAFAFGLAALAAVAAAVFFFLPAGLEPVAASAAQPSGDALIARGEYLTKAADCEACHTNPGGASFAGGRRFDLPFGTLYAPNLTPDREHGIGAWSNAEFVRALHHGIGRNGEDLYPHFPMRLMPCCRTTTRWRSGPISRPSNRSPPLRLPTI